MHVSMSMINHVVSRASEVISAKPFFVRVRVYRIGVSITGTIAARVSLGEKISMNVVMRR